MTIFYPFDGHDLHQYHDKVRELHAFIQQYAHLPEQGTPAWLEMRKTTIGGSELATVIGCNPYEKIYTLVASKMGWKVFRGNKYTRWGKLFEPVGQRLMEILMQCTIYETSSLPGAIPHTSYSPDGMAVVPCHVIEQLVEGGFIPEHTLPVQGDAITVLFEFKSPAVRTPNGTVPRHYLSQPVAGLGHFPHLDIAYFVDMQARKCSIYDLQAGNNHYDYDYHNRDGERIDLGEPIAYGIIGVYEPHFEPSEEPVPVSETMVMAFEIIPGQMMDIGDTDARMWERISTETTEWNGSLSTRYYDPRLWGDTIDAFTDINQFEKWCDKENHGLLGVIAYKIYQCDIIPVYRDPAFLHQKQEQVTDVVNIIKRIRASADPENEYRKIFDRTPSGVQIDNTIVISNDDLISAFEDE